MTDQEDQVNQDVGWLLAIMAAVGLVVFDPFGWDHFGPLRWLVLAGAGFWAIARSVNGGLFDRSPMTKLFCALLGWGAISSALGADKLHAWIGTPDRRFGWLTWVLCAGVFLVARQQGEEQRQRIVRWFAAGAVGLGCYALLEWLGVLLGSGPVWPAISTEFAGGRVGGPYGQPAFLGAAAMLAGPVAAGVAADQTQTRPWRVTGLVGAATCGLAILTSQSRAAWVGLLLAGLTYLAMIVSRSRSAPTRRLRDVQATAAVTAVFLVAVLLIGDLRQRVTEAFGSDGVIAGRTDEWRIGLRALGQAPVFGYGPEGYRTAFGANVDDSYILTWGWEVITDRSHNAILDVALAFGIPGALLFLTIIALAGAAAARAIGSAKPIEVGLGFGVVGYLVQQQFLFPLSEVDPLLWLAVGLLPAMAIRPSHSETAPGLLQPIIGGLTIGLAVIITTAALLDVAANIRLGRAFPDIQTTADPEQLDDAAQAATQLRPDSIRYHFIGARAARQNGDVPLAISRIEAGLELSANDPALLGERGRLLLELARETPAGPANDQAVLAAREALEALVLVAPNHPEHLQRLGIARALDGDVQAGITAMEEAARLAPDRPEPQQNLQELRRLAEDQ